MSSVIFYSTKKVQNYIRKRNVFLDDLMYSIQIFFEKKNVLNKIKHVRFALNDIIEEDKRVRRSLVVEVCADALPNEIINELNEMLAREFPSLNAFTKLHCEYA